MNDLDYVVNHLQGMNLKKISREIDVHYITIYNIARKKVTNPKVETINKISTYLRRRDA